jgi:hypothetical protein
VGRSDLRKINQIKLIKNMYHNEKEAVLKTVNIKLKVGDKKQKIHYNIQNSKIKNN